MSHFRLLQQQLSTEISDADWTILHDSPRPKYHTALQYLEYIDWLTNKQIHPTIRLFLTRRFESVYAVDALLAYYDRLSPPSFPKDLSLSGDRRVAFSQLVNALRVNPGNAFWESYCHNELGHCAPDDQNHLTFLVAMGHLSESAIHPKLREWLTTYYILHPTIGRLLAFIPPPQVRPLRKGIDTLPCLRPELETPSSSTPPSSSPIRLPPPSPPTSPHLISKLPAPLPGRPDFGDLIDAIKVSPGHHAWQTFVSNVMDRYYDGNQIDFLIQNEYLTPKYIHPDLFHWLIDGPYRDNPNVKAILRYYSH